MSSKAGDRAPVSLCGKRVVDGCFESSIVVGRLDSLDLSGLFLSVGFFELINPTSNIF